MATNDRYRSKSPERAKLAHISAPIAKLADVRSITYERLNTVQRAERCLAAPSTDFFTGIDRLWPTVRAAIFASGTGEARLIVALNLSAPLAAHDVRAALAI
jgi:hypothetical protein